MSENFEYSRMTGLSACLGVAARLAAERCIDTRMDVSNGLSLPKNSSSVRVSSTPAEVVRAGRVIRVVRRNWQEYECPGRHLRRSGDCRPEPPSANRLDGPPEVERLLRIPRADEPHRLTDGVGESEQARAVAEARQVVSPPM